MSTTTNELSVYAGNFLARMRSLRLYPAVVRCLGLCDIARDLAAEQRANAAAAHRAECADREAASGLADVLRDGRVTADEIPALRSALAQVSRSAEIDHDISERCTA